MKLYDSITTIAHYHINTPHYNVNAY